MKRWKVGLRCHQILMENLLCTNKHEKWIWIGFVKYYDNMKSLTDEIFVIIHLHKFSFEKFHVSQP